MRYWRDAASGFCFLVLTALLCLPGAARVFANPVLADAESLDNGAQLYELFCSECHGSDTAMGYGQLYEPSAADPLDEYDRVLESEREEEAAAQLIPVPEEDDWPEWAERPDPDAEREPDARMEVVDTMIALINEGHGIAPGQPVSEYADDYPGQGPSGGFVPVPGATNLADPTAYFYGTSEEEIFDSIANGTGAAMPGWRTELGSDEAIWDVVNYIRSFWGEEWSN